LLDVASGREIGRLDGPPNRCKGLAFSPDGTVIATGVDIDPNLPRREIGIRLWHVAAQKELARVKAQRGRLSALAFSPDGQRFVSARLSANLSVKRARETLFARDG
jgi:WD40 repeat protein